VYQESIINKVKGISYKTHYKNKQDKDKVFYLQQRGLSKETDIILSKLTDTYFIINIKNLFNNHE
jgi:succinate dehydrogenase flavin-adding protein (antitoxin of CptAB toxin-antitoxin module)